MSQPARPNLRMPIRRNATSNCPRPFALRTRSPHIRRPPRQIPQWDATQTATSCSETLPAETHASPLSPLVDKRTQIGQASPRRPPEHALISPVANSFAYRERTMPNPAQPDTPGRLHCRRLVVGDRSRPGRRARQECPGQFTWHSQNRRTITYVAATKEGKLNHQSVNHPWRGCHVYANASSSDLYVPQTSVAVRAQPRDAGVGSGLLALRRA